MICVIAFIAGYVVCFIVDAIIFKCNASRQSLSFSSLKVMQGD